MGRRGFSLVELLVVLAALVILLGALVPSLSQVREMARRSVCAANLRGLANAVANYYADNRGQLMCTASTLGGVPVPTCLLPAPDPNWDQAHQYYVWNLRGINPYIDAFSPDDPATGGVFLCPSSRTDRWQERFHEGLNRDYVQRPEMMIDTPYAYYAHVRSWEPFVLRNGAHNDITDKQPAPGRILLSDGVHLRLDRKLIFNHGSKGPRDPADTGPERSRPVGLNRAYGDGSVRWRDISEEEAALMREFFAYPRPFIGTGPGDDAFFY